MPSYLFINCINIKIIPICVLSCCLFSVFQCNEPASPYCIEGGGGNCVLMYTNKCSNRKKLNMTSPLLIYEECVPFQRLCTQYLSNLKTYQENHPQYFTVHIEKFSLQMFYVIKLDTLKVESCQEVKIHSFFITFPYVLYF